MWDSADEMEMLRHFWDAAHAVDEQAPEGTRVLRFGGPGELAGWLADSGFRDVVETTLDVASTYDDFEELWSGLLLGIGPAGAHVVSLSEGDQTALRRELFRRLGSPSGRFTLRAGARSATGRLPD